MNDQEQSSDLLNQLTRQMYQDHDPAKPTVTICLFENGEGLEEVNLLKAFEKAVKKRRVKINVDMMETPISGISEFSPVVILSPTNQSFTQVHLDAVDTIIDRFVADLKKTGLFFADPLSAAEDETKSTSHTQLSDSQKNTIGSALMGAFILGVRKIKKKSKNKKKSEKKADVLQSESSVFIVPQDPSHLPVDSVQPSAVPISDKQAVAADQEEKIAADQQTEKSADSSSDYIRMHSFSFDAEHDSLMRRDDGLETRMTVCPDLLPILIPGSLKIRPPHELDQLGLDRISEFETGTAAAFKNEKVTPSFSSKDDPKTITERRPANAYEAEYLTVSHLFLDSAISDQGTTEISSESKPDDAIQKEDTLTIKRENNTGFSLLEEWFPNLKTEDHLPCISICSGDGCSIQNGQKVFEEFHRVLTSMHMETNVRLKQVGCSGFCGQGPLVMLLPSRILYVKVRPADVQQIIEETLLKGNLIRSLLYRNPENQKLIPLEREIPFFQYQTRVLTESVMDLDPESLEDYIRHGGYQALANVLSSDPNQVIEEIKKSNLRGRGGAGFPTWKKLDICRSTASETKYVIVNGDAGDPGSMEDQALMSSNPHLILEGLIIGAYAVQASKGYIYIRNQYSSAVKRMENAVKEAAENGLIGNNILNSGFHFQVVIQLAASAYITGEEMNLIHSIEGFVGEPRKKPPYPAVSGLWGKPTVICNVKTWGSIPPILNHGGEWFSRMGTAQSGGTTLVSLTGAVRHSGYVEIQLGTSLKTLVEKIGSVPAGHPIKAVQIGAPFGAILPADHLNTPFDFISLEGGRSFLGSVIHSFPENTCIVQEVQKRLKFAEKESCGRCTACLAGIPQMIGLMDLLIHNKADKLTLVRLKEIATQMQNAAKCNFGKNVPIMVLSSLNSFYAEYEAHCTGECPGGQCPTLTVYSIDINSCSACGRCQSVCPTEAISGSDHDARNIDATLCVACGLCFRVCDDHAIHNSKYGEGSLS